jgi:cyanate permease
MFGQLGGTLVAAITPWLADYLGWEGSFLFTAGVALVGSLAWLPLDPNAQITVPASRTD